MPEAIFQSEAARASWISGWGERFSNGRTSCAGRRRTALRVERAGELTGGKDGGVQGLGGLVVGDQDKRRRGSGLHQVRQVKRAAGKGKPGDAAAALPGFQMAADPVKGVGMFEIRDAVRERKGESWCLPKFTSSRAFPSTSCLNTGFTPQRDGLWHKEAAAA